MNKNFMEEQRIQQVEDLLTTFAHVNGKDKAARLGAVLLAVRQLEGTTAILATLTANNKAAANISRINVQNSAAICVNLLSTAFSDWPDHVVKEALKLARVIDSILKDPRK